MSELRRRTPPFPLYPGLGKELGKYYHLNEIIDLFLEYEKEKIDIDSNRYKILRDLHSLLKYIINVEEKNE
jgi:hypothetical protein